ncbi:MAG TPA: class I SAM-dependent methyltransferase [Acidimicrobiaceae bacterium]|nr:class I SAM-dependent methyltransferase [Acidimicrobiaceae bacterium]
MTENDTTSASNEPWEDHARWWQDQFTDGVDPEYTEQILPIIAARLPTTGALLDIGAGEGQVARMATERGLSVSCLDPAWAQVSVGQERAGGPTWLQGSATHLPFQTDHFDAAVACLVFEHIPDPDSAISEVARVLKPGGEFLFLLNHPLLQTPNSGWIDDQMLEPPEQYWRIGDYLIEAETVEQVQKDVFITFFHRPLSRYLNALAGAGFVLREMVEPAPPQGFLDRAPEYLLAATIPRLLVLRLQYLPGVIADSVMG